MVSVERIINYSQLEPEADLDTPDDRRPPADWPTQGNIAFRDVSLRYDAKQAPVLDHIVFDIQPKEKASDRKTIYGSKRNNPRAGYN